MQGVVQELIQNAICELEIKANKTSQRPYLNVSFSRMSMVALYDTGADVCCISEEAFNRIPKHLQPRPIGHKAPRFRAANGEILPTLGKYCLQFKIGDKEIRHVFYKVRQLGDDAIIGIDLIHRYHLNYNTETRSFFWRGGAGWNTGILKVNKAQTLKEFTVSYVQCEIRTESGAIPTPGVPCMVTVNSDQCPLLVGGPAMVTPDQNGLVHVPVANAAWETIELYRNEPIGVAENLQDCQTKEISSKYIASVRREVEAQLPPEEKLTPEKEAFIRKNADLSHIPEEFKDRYLALILKHHAAISRDKADLGRTETLLHDIELRDKEPAYVQQFKIPDAHRDELHRNVAEWLKLGVVQPCRSKFNSPLFCVSKKNGGLRIVQDFRALNAKTLEDKYSMKDINECINEIGNSGSSLFTTIDLTAGFWQMLLQPKSRPYTAFTLPGKGQFQWVTTPMGLLGAPASFQRLMEKVVEDIKNVLVYIDDLLLHSNHHPEHLKLLDTVLHRLTQHGIKMNLQKCVFGSPEVTYLGFQLTPEGIKPGKDKLKAVANQTPPENTRQVRQFLGLCNFFRSHIRNFAQIAAPLTELTRKDCSWKAVPLPTKALEAFNLLKGALVSEPVVAYPRKGMQYALTTDAAVGDDVNPGGLGAILSQIDKQGRHHALGYASRKLTDYEKNYTPFLLEMQGALWGIEHFQHYLKGRPFLLFTDHKPLCGLGKVHKRTYDRLTHAMNTYNFQLLYKKGDEMPADYLSRNVVSAISWSNVEIANEQDNDDKLNWVKRYLLSGELPSDPGFKDAVIKVADGCFIEDGIVWKRIRRPNEPNRVVIFLPRRLISAVLEDAHGAALAGHDGILKTKERIMQCYYWSGMDADINKHIQECHKCQVRRKKHPAEPPQLLSPLPQCTEPQQRVHADLFGPLKNQIGDKKYVLSMTDAFTKYVELVVIPSKEASVVAKAIFDKWICRFGSPLEIVTDQGKEFCAKLTNELFSLLKVQHSTTSPYHPQCNSQAEVANKTIAKFLANVVDKTTLDWEDYIAPLMFSYNTSFHRSIKTTPFFLTHGMEPRQPGFEAADIRVKFEGPQSPEQMLQRLQKARELAQQNNEEATFRAQVDHDRKAAPHSYVRDQLVLLEKNYFLGENAKLSEKWTGPHRIIELKGETDVTLKMCDSGRKTTVHVDRIKPYHVKNNSEIIFPAPNVPPTVPARNPKTLPQPEKVTVTTPPPPLPRQRKVPPPVPDRVLRPRNKPSEISALKSDPKQFNLKGEGVQNISNSVLEQRQKEEEEEQWVLVIRKKPSKQKLINAWEANELSIQANKEFNYRMTGDSLFPPTDINDCVIEWYDTVDYDPLPGPVHITAPVQPPAPAQPPAPVQPPAPQPIIVPEIINPQPAAAVPSSPPSSSPHNDRSSDEDYRPPSSGTPDSSDIDQLDGASRLPVCREQTLTEQPDLSPEFQPPKPLFIKPAKQLPTARQIPTHVYLQVPALPASWNIDDFEARLGPLKKPEPAQKPASPTDGKFKPPILGGLFSRSSRSKEKLPDSVLHRYPDERTRKK